MKAGLGIAALTFILASCGVGAAPDGSGSLVVSDLRTEFRDQSGNYVGCDNVAQNGTITQLTNVAVYFTINGSVSTATISLRGTTNSQFDGYFTKTVSGSELASLGTNSYKLKFTANSSSGAYLPQSVRPQGIVVNPATVYIKNVTTDSRQGSFYANVSVNTGTSVYGANSIRTVPVYSGCNVISTTTEAL